MNKLTKDIAVKVAMLIIFAVFSSLTMAKSLTASVDRVELSVEESFVLTIQASGIATLSKPDFTVLDADFETFSRSQNHNIQISNDGEHQQTITWRLVLRAKHSGPLQIPVLSLAGVQSSAINMLFTKAQLMADDDADFQLVLFSDKQEVLLNEQVIVTLQFSYARQVGNVRANELMIDNAQVTRMEDVGYETQKNGRAFGVYEMNYAVFANSVGELIIPAQQLKAQLGRSSIFSTSTTKTINMQSQPLVIMVQARPKSASSYIVANAVELSEKWSADATITLGDSITREISLLVRGALGETIPVLEMAAVDNVNIYPEVANKAEGNNRQGVFVSRVRNFAIVPTVIGEFSFPAIDIQWWNSLDKKFQTAHLSAKIIRVIAPLQAAVTEEIKTVEKVQPRIQAAEIQTIIVKNPLNNGLLIACFALLAMVGVLLYLLYSKRALVSGVKLSVVPVDESEKTAFEQLLQALNANSDLNIHRSVHLWAKVAGVSDWGGGDLEKQLQQLEAMLFSGNQDNATYDAAALKVQIKSFRKSLVDSANGNAGQGSLATLYPSASKRAAK